MGHIMGMRAVAAACLACALAAQAAPVSVPVGGSFTGMDPGGSGQIATAWLIEGSSSWALSDGPWKEEKPYWTIGGMVGVLNLINAKVLGIGESLPTEQFWTDPDFGDVYRTRVTVPLQVASAAFDTVTSQITSVSTTGGVQFTASRLPGTLTGGTASISNLRFDLVNKTVAADLAGVKSAVGTNPSINYNVGPTTLWTFANVVAGSEAIDPTTFALSLTFSDLSISTTGYDFLKGSLGLGAMGLNDLSNVSNYGSIQTRLVFSTAVPEPSTYALLGVGLVGLLVGLRRRVAEN